MANAQTDIYRYQAFTTKAQESRKAAQNLIDAIRSGDAESIVCASGSAIATAGGVIALVPCGKCQVVGGAMLGVGSIMGAIAC